MVCPLCISSAIVANLPFISASVGGVVAAKVAHKQMQQVKSRQSKARPLIIVKRMYVNPENYVPSVQDAPTKENQSIDS